MFSFFEEMLINFSGIFFFNQFKEWMIRIISLDINFTFSRVSTCSSRNLRNQLIGSFFRSEILNIQQCICFWNRYQFYIIKIQSFRNHLRSYHNFDFSRFYFFVEFFVGKFLTHAVYIHSLDLCFFKDFLRFFFYLFYADSTSIEVCTLAFRTNFRFLRFVTTVMAFQLVGRFMIGHHHITIAAIGNMTATFAFYHVCVTSSVVQNDGLLFMF